MPAVDADARCRRAPLTLRPLTPTLVTSTDYAQDSSYRALRTCATATSDVRHHRTRTRRRACVDTVPPERVYVDSHCLRPAATPGCAHPAGHCSHGGYCLGSETVMFRTYYDCILFLQTLSKLLSSNVELLLLLNILLFYEPRIFILI